MLFNESKSEHITGQFVEPHFIQTDASGIIVGMSEKSARLLSGSGKFDQRSDSLLTIFKNLSFNELGFSTDQKIETLPASIDLLLSSPPEKEKCIRWTISSISFGPDQLNGWQFTGMEIDPKKNLNQGTRIHPIAKSERDETLSDSIINSLPGIFYLFNQEGKFLRWNKRFESVTGYSAEEIARMNPRDFFDEDEKDYISGRIEKAFIDGVSDAEANLLTRDRKKIPHYFTGQHILFEERACLIGMGIDVNGKKAAEEEMRISNERYMLATKVTNDAIFDWDLKSGFCFWGERFYAEFGYVHDEGVNKIKFWEDHIHHGDRERIIASVNQFIASKSTGVWSEEYRFQRSDEKYSIVSDKKFLVFDNEENAIRVVGSMQDITEKKKLEKKLLKQELTRQKQVAQAIINVQEKERAEIGLELHDNVNQILSTCKLYLELAKTNERERMNLIDCCSENINQAINEIRNISRALVPASIEDLGLQESIHDLVEHINVTKKINVEFYSINWSDELIGNGQKLTLFRIIQEQVNNVLKHAHASNLIIELEMDEFENCIRLNIADDGIGFDPEKIKSKKSLGFSNIISRTDLFDGEISIVAAPEKGCKLNVQIPIYTTQLNKLYE